MRIDERAALASAGLCVFWAALRALSPQMPFDWMSLTLIGLAAAAILLSGLRAAPRAKKAPAAPADEEARAEEPPASAAESSLPADWEPGHGGVFDTLEALGRDAPFTALCSARGMLAILPRAKASGQDAEALAALTARMDDALARGERRLGPEDARALLDEASRALGHLERLG